MMGFLKRFVFHNFSLKVMSLLFATALWFMIARDERPAEVALRAPIVFQNVPPNLEISSESIPQALIRVRGPERVIRQLGPNEVQAELDLAGSKPQERTFDLTAQQVRILGTSASFKSFPANCASLSTLASPGKSKFIPGSPATSPAEIKSFALTPILRASPSLARASTSKRLTLPQPIPSMPREP